MIRIAAVSYLNTRVWVEAFDRIEWPQEVNIQLLPPCEIAKSFVSGSSDIALLPVGALKNLADYKLVTDYCIGADGDVASVILASNNPLEQCKTVYLDYESVTSSALAKILVKDYLKLNPEFLMAQPGYEKLTLNSDSAILIIGDRALAMKSDYKYILDLAGEWKNWQHLPFAFACWVCRPNVDQQFIDFFSMQLAKSVDALPQFLSGYKHESFDSNLITNYLTHNISYHFDAEKRKAVELFLKLI